jgi:RNA polymerase sigma-70 factor (ECF subfamily)
MLSRRRTVLNHAREKDPVSLNKRTVDSPDFILAKREEAKLVQQTLDRLDMDTREILIMKYIQGRSYDSIAQLLSIPRGTVMSRLFYARKAFREKYLRWNGTECNRIKGGRHE